MNNTFKKNLLSLSKLAIPFALSGIAQSSVYFFETIFFAHLGPNALAAGALVGWLAGTLAVILFGTLNAINILISHKYGSDDQHSIALILRDGVILAIVFSIPLFFLYWNSPFIFQLLGQQPNITLLAKPYLHALAWSTLPNMLMIVLIELLMGLGSARIILFFDILYVSLTIVMSYLLIFGKLGLPSLGIAGAGWSVLISSLVTAVMLGLYLIQHKDYRKYFHHILKFSKPSFLLELIQVGIPMGAMFCVEVAFFLALSLFMGHLGAKALAANQIAMQYLGVFISIVFAIAQAITVQMGQLLGAEKPLAAQKTAYIGIVLNFLLTFLVAICYWVFPKLFIAIDFDVHNAENFPIISFATKVLAICALFQLVESIRLSLFGALRALKDTHFTLIVSILSFWCLALPLGYFSANYLNLGGLGFWWGMVIGAACSIVVLYKRFQYKMRQFY